MKTKKILVVGCMLSLVASSCFAVELTLDALRSETSIIPSSYAEIVKYKDKNEDKEKIVFNGSGVLYGPSALNQILEGYGIKLQPQVLKDKSSEIPSSFARIVKYKDKGEVKEKIVFGKSSVFYGPSALNQILEGYGVKLQPQVLKDKSSEIPSSFARIVKYKDKGEVKEKIVFGNTSTFYGPSKLNHILAAYN